MRKQNNLDRSNWDDDDDDLPNMDDFDDFDDDDLEEEYNTLRQLVLKFFQNNNIECSVDNDEDNIIVHALIARNTKLSTVIRLLDVAYRAHTDLFPQYSTEVELTRDRKTGMAAFQFSYILDFETSKDLEEPWREDDGGDWRTGNWDSIEGHNLEDYI